LDSRASSSFDEDWGEDWEDKDLAESGLGVGEGPFSGLVS
jgi:hypothetical protein